MNPDEHEQDNRPWYADDDFEEADLADTIAADLSACGIMRDGYCSFAGSEYCDWQCPIARRE